MNPADFIDYRAAVTPSHAVTTRRSLRAFTAREVDAEIIEDMLEKAARAPSGTNMQPWQAYVVRGQTRARLCEAACEAFDTERVEHDSERHYYPREWFEPYITRRRKVGWDLYGLLGIGKGEFEKTHAQHRRNFQFFDAPVGVIYTIHRDLETGSWLDYGMFLQNVMVLAREAGLHTCPQAAWADFHRVIRRVLPIPDEQVVVCGMAIGYADESAVENSLVTEREPLETWVRNFD